MNKKTIASINIGFALFSINNGHAATPKQPNILCITCEDISPYLKCYGDPVAKTPNLDRFSTEAIRYTRMFTTVGVSAPSRAALITGMYPSAIGANNMRNLTQATDHLPKGLPSYEVVLPDGVKCYTEYLRAKGYYCTNNKKTDYQFEPPLTAWDECGKNANWQNTPKGKPFFSIINLEVTHESQIWKRGGLPLVVDPKTVPVPPYFPDDSVVRHDIAVMYSNIFEMDRQFQQIIDELTQANELDNTIIIWYSDNGGPLPRQKRSIYESGALVPFMIRYPDGYRKGEVEDRLCMFIDIPATILSIAGIETPKQMHGEAFLGKYAKKDRKFVYGARDRMDEQIDKQGCIRDNRFRYIRNYNPEKANYMPIKFRLQIPMMQRMIDLLAKDSLNEEQKQWFAMPRGEEEFYDVEYDPHEMTNLIHDKKYEAEINRLRKEYQKWVAQYNSGWMQSETERFYKMWPNGQQPIAESPVIEKKKNTIQINSATKGSSIAYQINGKGESAQHWFLYTGPITVNPGDQIRAKAVRIGYKESKTTNYNNN